MSKDQHYTKEVWYGQQVLLIIFMTEGLSCSYKG